MFSKVEEWGSGQTLGPAPLHPRVGVGAVGPVPTFSYAYVLVTVCCNFYIKALLYSLLEAFDIQLTQLRSYKIHLAQPCS